MAEGGILIEHFHKNHTWRCAGADSLRRIAEGVHEVVDNLQ